MREEITFETELNDSDLVTQSLAGSRDAFGQIVGRYQSLVCSLAYSATGSLSESEDLAQETFLAVWKQLPQLRDPAKLRSWLCQIARNHIHNTLRKQGREPSHAAHPLEIAHETHSEEALPIERAIQKEEEAILWRSLERIPESYREPLILFYRENQSIESVALKLDLSEDAVKQRLSRGRKLLAGEVTAFVEGALRQSAPGKAFTIGVLAALPGFTLSVKAAAIGATAAEGSAAAKGAGAMGLVGAILTPLLVVSGFWAAYRIELDSAASDSERQYAKSFLRRLIGCIAGFFVGYAILMIFARPLLAIDSWLLPGLLIALALVYTAAIVALCIWSVRKRRRVLAELESQGEATNYLKPAWEYRSKSSLFGLPLVHIRIGGNLLANRTPVKAWIAIGSDCAFGGLFAFGGLAVAPLSIGGCAVGLLPFGAFAIGVLAIGGLSIGAWSFGGLALGWQAFGGLAIAWNAALGGAAIARDFALGGFAHAAQANNEIAAHFIQPHFFFENATIVRRNAIWLHLLWVPAMFLWWRTVRRARGAKEATP